MTPACPRVFEAEAWRDGRLSGAEVVRFQAHAKVCPRCKQELRSLEALGEALRAGGASVDELHVRRERTRLLAAFDAQLVPAPRRPRALLWGGPLAASLLVLVVWLTRPTPQVAAPAALEPAPRAQEPVLVRSGAEARWSRQGNAERETIVLESGELSIQVEHAGSPRRVLVILPDGELEDIGTTFSVSARAGRTESVEVQEGMVMLRLHGRPALQLSAGQIWKASPLAPAGSAPPVAPPRSAKPSSATPAAPPASAVPAAVDAGVEFRAAMAALERGDNSQAASRFGSFAAGHPRDSRAEDAAYLRVLALQRAGNPTAMQAAARDYLQRYPRGFRRAEIEALAREP